MVCILVGCGSRCELLPTSGAGPAACRDRRRAEVGRRQILESERWRRAQRGFDEWLSIQQLYSPDEVSVLRAQFQLRVERMSPAELQAQLEQLEEKLAVLASPEAEDARRWLAQFLAVQARYTDQQLRQMRPDVANMSASQIRQELESFQQRRGQSRQSQAAVQQGRALQVQSAQDNRAAQQRAIDAARQNAARNTAATTRSPSTPTRDDLPGHSEPPVSTSPAYTVGPWGNPIRWDPLAGFW